jgi:putative endonuclease
MKTSAQGVGRWGEELAAEYLRQCGYTILDRNARTPYGEIDLIASQECAEGHSTVFIEVKTRRSTAYGPPEAAVTPEKSAHLLAAAQAYLQAHPELNGVWRVDVIAIRRVAANLSPEIVHFENAISSQ